MPPHCDTLDGPVVKAARKALEAKNVNYVLPWVPKEAEAELTHAFDIVLHVRALGKEAEDLADYWFFETAVRLHRMGEGAEFTGLKPAGLDVGPVVPRAETALQMGDPKALIEYLKIELEAELLTKFKHAWARQKFDVNDVEKAREYVRAMLDFMLFSNHLYLYLKGKEE